MKHFFVENNIFLFFINNIFYIFQEMAVEFNKLEFDEYYCRIFLAWKIVRVNIFTQNAYKSVRISWLLRIARSIRVARVFARVIKQRRRSERNGTSRGRNMPKKEYYNVTPEQREIALWRDAKRRQLRELYLKDSGHPTKSLLVRQKTNLEPNLHKYLWYLYSAQYLLSRRYFIQYFIFIQSYENSLCYLSRLTFRFSCCIRKSVIRA